VRVHLIASAGSKRADFASDPKPHFQRPNVRAASKEPFLNPEPLSLAPQRGPLYVLFGAPRSFVPLPGLLCGYHAGPALADEFSDSTPWRGSRP
jgi:hypothetical protein